MARPQSIAGQLVRLGFHDVDRSERIAVSPGLAGLADDADVLASLSESADPDLALLNLERVVIAAGQHDIAQPLRAAILDDPEFRSDFTKVLGASEALAEHLVRHPDHYTVLLDDEVRTQLSARELADEMRAAVREAYSEGTWHDGALALRVVYRRRLLALAARDLNGKAHFASVTSELAELADGVLAAALELAQLDLPADATPCRLAIIAMGKCGGQELNYVSDVDVIFVAEPAELPDGTLADEYEALQTATLLARGVMRAANESTVEGTIWEVDPALRPEGKSGALVRTLASHIGYYERWAQTWEFQALLKARFTAGDEALGRAYIDAIVPFIWTAAARPDFVKDVQAMRRRVEEQLPADQAERELKLGRGGLRDVEFSVQLLEMVHGRSDVMVRSPNTIIGLEAMATSGYVSRDDAATMSAAYQFLRSMEHRLQLFRLQRTHTVPDDEEALRRLGRSMGYTRDSAKALTAQWQKHKVAVRRHHEKLFYRPLLNAVANLEPGEARLSEGAARERLTALGYVDPQGALRHIEALTSGISRRAAIQRTLLPVMLGWFADAPNPDAGLAAFREVSDALGSSPWYLRLLRDESETAERMAHVVAASRFATGLLRRAPECVAMLGDLAELKPRSRSEIRSEMFATSRRHEDADRAALAVRTTRARELFRIAAADITGVLNPAEVGHALSDISDATLEATLQVAKQAVSKSFGGSIPTRFAVIAMGRLGGRETGYGSDVDAMFVHDPLPDADDEQAGRAAIAIANELRRLLALPSSDPPVDIDADLRPEGRTGALVRTLKSYEAYYARWSSPWEAQALLRARPLAGNADLCDRFIALIDPLRYPVDGIAEADVVEARRIKARMEAERLPKGADPSTHVKLGRGGLSDVEWAIQLIQMRNAGRSADHALRTTGTLEAMQAAVNEGLLSEFDQQALASAWLLATHVRNATFLVTSRSSDQVPTDFSTMSSVAYILGYPSDERAMLTPDYLRVARHARTVMERLFYGWDDTPLDGSVIS